MDISFLNFLEYCNNRSLQSIRQNNFIKMHNKNSEEQKTNVDITYKISSLINKFFSLREIIRKLF